MPRDQSKINININQTEQTQKIQNQSDNATVNQTQQTLTVQYRSVNAKNKSYTISQTMQK